MIETFVDSEHFALNRETFDFIIDAERFTARIDPTLQEIHYWYDREATLTTETGEFKMASLFDSFVATRVCQAHMPALLEEIEVSHLLVFRIGILCLTTDKQVQLARMTARCRELGFSLGDVTEHRFQHGRLDVSLTIFKGRPAGITPTANARPIE